MLLSTFLLPPSLRAQANRTESVYPNQIGDKELMISPNPAKDNVNLQIKNANVKLKSIVIYSIIGMQVAEFNNLNQSSIDLRLDRLYPGKYLVKYTLSDGIQRVKQMIKQ